MLIVLFRSKLVPEPEGYAEMAQEMSDLAKTMPGFIDVKAYTAADGERLTVVWWEDEDTLRAWRTHARHLVAQKAGRERWYEYYDLDVAEVKRRKRFDRDDGERASASEPRERSAPAERRARARAGESEGRRPSE